MVPQVLWSARLSEVLGPADGNQNDREQLTSVNAGPRVEPMQIPVRTLLRRSTVSGMRTTSALVGLASCVVAGGPQPEAAAHERYGI